MIEKSNGTFFCRACWKNRPLLTLDVNAPSKHKTCITCQQKINSHIYPEFIETPVGVMLVSAEAKARKRANVNAKSYERWSKALARL